jgi:gamma-glutamyl:cysteine ligase YbdK (ATP-grasp superfamily)
MAEYGYDWHQTTVGRTETATRPLRLNEAVALAGLFEVPVTQLVAPPKVAESAELAAQIQATEERLRAAQAARDAAADAAADAAERAKAASYHAAEAAAELSRCSGELDRLLAIRGTLTRERGR